MNSVQGTVLFWSKDCGRQGFISWIQGVQNIRYESYSNGNIAFLNLREGISKPEKINTLSFLKVFVDLQKV